MQPVSLWVQRSCGATAVAVQTSDHEEGDDVPDLRQLHLRWQGNTLADAPMRAGVVEDAGVLSDHFGQMALVADEHAFAYRIRTQRLAGRGDGAHAL